MIAAEIPKNEAKRLEELYRYGILDTPAEDDFDDLVKLASELCDTPISLLTLIDSDRQWFKARIGIDVEETSREVSFCAHAIHEPSIMEVNDAWNDIRFVDNPYVLDDPNIRFYAGVPLISSKGYALGTLCVLDKQPRELNAKQKDVLTRLGKQAIRLLELRALYGDSKKQKFILEELTQRQQRIISIMAHDIRNPLAALSTLLDLQMDDSLDAMERHDLCVMAKDQVDGTVDTLNRILDWSKMLITESKPRIREFSPYETANKVFASLVIPGQLKNVRLDNKIDPNLKISSDAHYFQFIVRNLVSNSIKFTEAGSIKLELKTYKGRNRIIVTDTGIGMDAELLNKLFHNEPVDSTDGTRNEGGSGLGTLLIKEFVDKLQGEVTVKSEKGKGTSIEVLI